MKKLDGKMMEEFNEIQSDVSQGVKMIFEHAKRLEGIIERSAKLLAGEGAKLPEIYDFENMLLAHVSKLKDEKEAIDQSHKFTIGVDVGHDPSINPPVASPLAGDAAPVAPQGVDSGNAQASETANGGVSGSGDAAAPSTGMAEPIPSDTSQPQG